MARLRSLRFGRIGFGVVIRTFLRYGLCLPNRPVNAAWLDNFRIDDVLRPRAYRRAQNQCAKEPNSIAPNHGREITNKMFVCASASAAYALPSERSAACKVLCLAALDEFNLVAFGSVNEGNSTAVRGMWTVGQQMAFCLGVFS